ncbi:MAG TPA: hypothetical protein VFB06_25265 [Streptosporangiaceae bacterium]|nr:hypothetical protein [Streptosporangiaceae bacterium]
MSRVRRTIVGVLASAALLTSAGGAVLSVVATAAPNGVAAATAIEYGAKWGPAAVE